MIVAIPHPVSPGLSRENAVHAQSRSANTREGIVGQFPSGDAYVRPFAESAEGLQFAQAVRELPPRARVLDIGVGRGVTSLYLAVRGFRVTVAEPSPDLCRYTELAAEAFGIPLRIYNVSAEYLHRLPDGDFDACIFNASLHHCDEPVRALTNCHQLLTDDGKLFLLNEPILQLFRSKARFHRRLEGKPAEMGHYGGNEHIYYYHEYRAMLRQAGFARVRDDLSLRYANPGSYLGLLARGGKKGGKVLLRNAYYKAVQGLSRCPRAGRPCLALMKRLSLLQVYFIAAKRLGSPRA